MIPLVVYAATQAVSAPSKFAPPFDTMQDIKGDIVYADRTNSFFIIIKDGIFYVGHPNREGGQPGEDVAYTWGRPQGCSNKDMRCVELGAYIFVRPNNYDASSVSFYNKTAVNAWREDSCGWLGSGVRSAFESSNNQKDYNYRPIMTYYYEVAKDGKISRIRLTYWRVSGDVPTTYDLRLETKRGLEL